MAGKLSADGKSLGAATSSATARACGALAIAIGGGALVFLVVAPIAGMIGIHSDIGFNALGNLLWLTLAIGGALLLGQRLMLAVTPGTTAALPLGIAGYAAALAIVALAGKARLLPSASLDGGAFLIATLGFILGAFAEEALFRGFLQPLLCRAWGTTIGVIVAAAGFGIVHVVGGWRNPISQLNIALAGAWFGLLAARTGGFGVPFLAHTGWNWAEALLFGASPNPGHDPAGSIFDVDLVGPGWLGGSGDGMNSALPATIVLALLIAPLVIWRPRVAAIEPQPALPRVPMPELRP